MMRKQFLDYYNRDPFFNVNIGFNFDGSFFERCKLSSLVAVRVLTWNKEQISTLFSEISSDEKKKPNDGTKFSESVLSNLNDDMYSDIMQQCINYIRNDIYNYLQQLSMNSPSRNFFRIFYELIGNAANSANLFGIHELFKLYSLLDGKNNISLSLRIDIYQIILTNSLDYKHIFDKFDILYAHVLCNVDFDYLFFDESNENSLFSIIYFLCEKLTNIKTTVIKLIDYIRILQKLLSDPKNIESLTNKPTKKTKTLTGDSTDSIQNYMNIHMTKYTYTSDFSKIITELTNLSNLFKIVNSSSSSSTSSSSSSMSTFSILKNAYLSRDLAYQLDVQIYKIRTENPSFNCPSFQDLYELLKDFSLKDMNKQIVTIARTNERPHDQFTKAFIGNDPNVRENFEINSELYYLYKALGSCIKDNSEKYQQLVKFIDLLTESSIEKDGEKKAYNNGLLYTLAGRNCNGTRGDWTLSYPIDESKTFISSGKYLPSWVGKIDDWSKKMLYIGPILSKQPTTTFLNIYKSFENIFCQLFQVISGENINFFSTPPQIHTRIIKHLFSLRKIPSILWFYKLLRTMDRNIHTEKYLKYFGDFDSIELHSKLVLFIEEQLDKSDANFLIRRIDPLTNIHIYNHIHDCLESNIIELAPWSVYVDAPAPPPQFPPASHQNLPPFRQNYTSDKSFDPATTMTLLNTVTSKGSLIIQNSSESGGGGGSGSSAAARATVSASDDTDTNIHALGFQIKKLVIPFEILETVRVIVTFNPTLFTIVWDKNEPNENNSMIIKINVAGRGRSDGESVHAIMIILYKIIANNEITREDEIKWNKLVEQPKIEALNLEIVTNRVSRIVESYISYLQTKSNWEEINGALTNLFGPDYQTNIKFKIAVMSGLEEAKTAGDAGHGDVATDVVIQGPDNNQKLLWTLGRHHTHIPDLRPELGLGVIINPKSDPTIYPPEILLYQFERQVDIYKRNFKPFFDSTDKIIPPATFGSIDTEGNSMEEHDNTQAFTMPRDSPIDPAMIKEYKDRISRSGFAYTLGAFKKYLKYKYKYLKANGANINILENYKNKLLNLNIKNISEYDFKKYNNKYHKYKEKYLNINKNTI